MLHTFQVKALSTDSVEEFVKKAQQVAADEKKHPGFSWGSLGPFNPSEIGQYNIATHKILSENPDATPDCTWDTTQPTIEKVLVLVSILGSQQSYRLRCMTEPP